MAHQWLFKSETYDNCNCAVNCGCQFNLPSTHGYCQSAFVGNIVEGHFNDTPLAGLNWAALYKWPDEIREGSGKRKIVIEERADEALFSFNALRIRRVLAPDRYVARIAAETSRVRRWH